MKTLMRLLPALAALALLFALAGTATVTGAYYFLRPGLPDTETLRTVELQQPLRVYTRDGRLMAQIGEKRRTPLEYPQIPEVVVQAFLAAEDDRFFEHPGFDYQGITRAAINLAVTGSRSQGGSTITQQLARVYFLTRERSFVRKARELILAVQIEREFSKEEILALYLNKIFLGQRSYGVAAAAEIYFGKPVGELSVAEAAVIAGIPKAPSVLNPVSNPARATERRAYVLRRMRELDFIDEAAYQDALATPLVSRLHGPIIETEAPYVTEMVRAEAVARFGDATYSDGYRIVTTVDSRLQAAADRALRTALLEYDRRHGYRGPLRRDALNDVPAGDAAALAEAADRVLREVPIYNELRPAVVTAVGDDNSVAVRIRDGGNATLAWPQVKWAPYISDSRKGPEPGKASEMLAAGDVVYLLSTANGWRLGQLPVVQGAFVALDPYDGATVALSGGYDFSASKYNRAVQARRQPGSSFKPFIYSAALENGYTPASIINDAPVVFDDELLEETWRPENYSRRFNGPTRMREALVRSLNLVSVRLVLGMGVRKTIRHIEPFGFVPGSIPRDPSLALGSGGTSPWDLAAGYAVFANGGQRVSHYVLERIIDAGDEVVYRADPPTACGDCPTWWHGQEPPAPEAAADPFAGVPRYRDAAEMIRSASDWRPDAREAPEFFRHDKAAPRVITAQNAYIVYDMMRDVIQRGTGRRARDLGRGDIAGKTGTSNDRRDAWFSGFNASLVATAWVGFDQERSLGPGEEGSRTALPMWKAFMGEALAGTPESLLPRPPGITTVRIARDTGLVAPAGYADAVFEIFPEDRVPAVMAAPGGGPGGVLPIEETVAEEDIF